MALSTLQQVKQRQSLSFFQTQSLKILEMNNWQVSEFLEEAKELFYATTLEIAFGTVCYVRSFMSENLAVYGMFFAVYGMLA